MRLAVAAAILVLAAPAVASHPDPRDMERVRALAHRLDDAAEHLHRSAEARAHHGDRYEARALRALHRLAREAEHFHQQVESHLQDPWHTEEDFDRLYDAFLHARAHLGDLHATEHVWDDWERVDDRFHDLSRYYRLELDRRAPWHRPPVPWWGPPWRRW
jgi:hypothetical protein